MSLHSFLTRLIWICMLPLVLLAAYLAVDRVRTLQAETDLEARNLATNFAIAIDQHLIARIGALQVLVASPHADVESDWNQLYREAQTFHESLGSHVILADPEMRMLFNTRAPFGTRLPSLPAPKGRAAAPAAMQTGKPAIGDIVFGPVANEPLIAIAVPGLRKGKIAFLLLATFETRQLQSRLEKLALPSGWSLTLYDGQNDVIGRRAPPGLNSASDVDAHGRFVVKSEVSPWSVVLEIPHAVYHAPLIKAAAGLAITILGATFVGALGAQIASRRLGSEVASLVATPAHDAPPAAIAEITAVRRLLDESTLKREAADAERRAGEEKLRAFYDLGLVGLAITSPEKGWIRVNHCLCQMLEYPEEELRKTTWAQLTHPDDLAADLQHFDRLLAGEIDGYSLEKRFIGRSGKIIPTQLVVRCVRNATGDIDFVTAMVEDISKRKLAEEALRASEERFRIAAETANDVIYEWDMKQSVQWLGNIDEMLAYEPGEFPRTLDGWVNSIHPDDTELTMAAIQDHLEGRGPYVAEYRVRRKDGVYRWWAARGTAARTTDRKPVRWIGSVTDITERKRVETALLESESRFRQLAESLPQLVWTCQPDGSCDYLNPQWIEYTGVPEARQHGFGWLEQLHPDDRAPTVAAWEATVASGTDFRVEFRIRRHSGEYRWFDTQAVQLRDADGHTVKWFGSNTDITERKLAEEEILRLNTDLERRVAERTAELTASNTELDSFAYSVSHDLRAPLRSIDGFAKMLEEDYASRLGEEGLDALNRVRGAAQRMGELIDDLLKLSRLTRADMNVETVDLSALARAVADKLREGEPERSVAFEIPPQIEVRGDARLLAVLLENLLGNAWKFTGRHPAAHIELGIKQKDGSPVYFVRDDGAGFDMAHAANLFAPFQRLHSVREFPGTGIGLATVRRIVQRHGGSVWAEGAVDKGAAFYFTLSA